MVCVWEIEFEEVLQREWERVSGCERGSIWDVERECVGESERESEKEE